MAFKNCHFDSRGTAVGINIGLQKSTASSPTARALFGS